jgi:hypothetical protein
MNIYIHLNIIPLTIVWFYFHQSIHEAYQMYQIYRSVDKDEVRSSYRHGLVANFFFFFGTNQYTYKFLFFTL